jgi:hypothetical protein
MPGQKATDWAAQSVLDAKEIASLRSAGIGWRAISADKVVGVGTAPRHAAGGSKTGEKIF